MAGSSADSPSRARRALRVIIAEQGPAALSSPARMSNLLSDLLPDDGGIARMFVAATDDHIADQLNELAAQGLDMTTALTLVTASFTESTMFTRQACAWVVGEFAVALRLLPENPSLPPPDRSFLCGTAPPRRPRGEPQWTELLTSVLAGEWPAPFTGSSPLGDYRVVVRDQTTGATATGIVDVTR